MNLSPEEKAIGKENYHAAIGSKLTRREFLEGGLAAGVVSGAGLGSFYYGYEAVNNPVRVGVIGTGDEGGVLIGAISPDYVQVTSIADIRPYNIHRAFHGDHSSAGALKVRSGLMTKYGWSSESEARNHVKVYTDQYDEMLSDPDIEGVIIALPLHLHHEAAIKAMRAGKHVLTEKLMGHSIGKCKDMSRVSRQERKLLATGHQRHYSILYDNAVDIIRQGLLGDLHHIRAQWHRGNLPGRDSWSQPMPGEIKQQLEELIGKIQATEELLANAGGAELAKQTKRMDDLRRRETAVKTEWTLRAMDAEVDAARYGYQPKTLQNGSNSYEVTPLEELIRWRLWNRTGGGLMAELGSHQLDAAGIFISAMREDGEKSLPLSVSGMGGRNIFPLDRECDDHVYCMYEFPTPAYEENPDDPNNRLVVTYSSINGNGYGGYGEIVMGTEGTLILEREQEVMLFKGSATTTNVKVSKGSGSDGGPTLSTSDSGPPAEAAVGKAAMESGPPSRGYTEEIEHWAYCIRNFDPETQEPQPKCKPEVALGDAVIALTSNIAIESRRQINFDPLWFDIDSDETPEGEKPTIPV